MFSKPGLERFSKTRSKSDFLGLAGALLAYNRTGSPKAQAGGLGG